MVEIVIVSDDEGPEYDPIEDYTDEQLVAYLEQVTGDTLRETSRA